MRGANKGQQANTVIPEGFPVKRVKEFDAEAFMARLSAKLEEGETETLKEEEVADVTQDMDNDGVLHIP